MSGKTSDQFLPELGRRLAALGPKTVAEAWEMAAEVYEDLMGWPVDRESAYDIAVVGAVVRGDLVRSLLADWTEDS